MGLIMEENVVETTVPESSSDREVETDTADSETKESESETDSTESETEGSESETDSSDPGKESQDSVDVIREYDLSQIGDDNAETIVLAIQEQTVEIQRGNIGICLGIGLLVGIVLIHGFRLRKI